jgi:hypothetical protein
MSHKFIKATLLKSPDDIDFIAFFDFDDLIRDQKAAQAFFFSMRLLTSLPMVISYRVEQQWRNFSLKDHEKLVQYVHGLSDDERNQLTLSNAVLTIPRMPAVGE